ncbi:MAG: hypothetical protein Q8M08_06925 [Bacteroidales bacterium]|nr:hypothetical protein [Bacteroidales bacterium]
MIFRRSLRYFCLLCILFVTTSSCEKFSGDQTIPAYLSIDSIYLSTDYYLHGTSSQRITDAWVYVDDEFLGVYELPSRLPVLKSGKHKLRIWPGIKKNGIAATRVGYEFYNPITREVDFVPDSTTRTGVLGTTYQTTTIFVWKEDFEDVAQSLDTTSGSTAYIQRTSAGSALTFEGSHSGMVVLDSLHDYFECQTHTEYSIPFAAVFLEMDFNTSNPLTVGLFTYGTTLLYQTPVVTLNPTNGQWKKIYIDLTTTLNAYNGMSSYRVYFRALKDTGLNQSRILFDNFKVVTRKSK